MPTWNRNSTGYTWTYVTGKCEEAHESAYVGRDMHTVDIVCNTAINTFKVEFTSLMLIDGSRQRVDTPQEILDVGYIWAITFSQAISWRDYLDKVFSSTPNAKAS